METYWVVIQKKVYIPGSKILMIEYGPPNMPKQTIQVHLAYAIHVKNKEGSQEGMYTLRCEVDQMEFIDDAPFKEFHAERVKTFQYDKKKKK